MGAVAVPLGIAALGLMGTAFKGKGGKPAPKPATVAAGAPKPPATGRRQGPREGTVRDGKRQTPMQRADSNTLGENLGATSTSTATGKPAASSTAGTPTPPDANKARADAAEAARRMAMRTRRKGASQRPGTLLTGPVTGSNLSPRTLLGYS